MKPAQIGAAGVLLVQYHLLKNGIDSAPMTTDDGIDLVAYAPKNARAITIQVKTCERPKRSGGKGKHALDWWLPADSPAQLVAVADLGSSSAWLFRHADFTRFAQQRPKNGKLHFYFYTDAAYQPKRPLCHARDFEVHRIEVVIPKVFG